MLFCKNNGAKLLAFSGGVKGRLTLQIQYVFTFVLIQESEIHRKTRFNHRAVFFQIADNHYG